MKLRKTWIGICVWVIYLVGMIFAIGVTGFVSGLFLSYDRYIVAGGSLAICVVAAVIIGLIGNKIGEKLNENEKIKEWKKPVWMEILVPVIIAVVAFFAFSHSSLLVSEFSGNLTIYDNATVAMSGETPQYATAAEAGYASVLRVIMSFLGNSLNVAFSINLALRIIMVLFLYIAVRISIGMLPAMVFGFVTAFVPSFGYSLRTIDSAQLIFTALAFETLLVVLYVKGFEHRVGTRWFYKLFSILLGGFMGLMIYLDAAAAVPVVFLLSAWALADIYGETFDVCINEILLLLSGVAAFIGMLIWEGGTGSVPDTYYRWTWRFYGYNNSPWLIMVKNSLPNTYFAFAILGLAFIPAILYLTKERCEKITPWLIYSVLMILVSVFLGETVANSEVMIIAAFVILISCGFACFAYVEGADDIIEIDEPEEESEEEESEEVAPEEKSESEETIETEETPAESVGAKEETTETEQEKEVAEATEEVKEEKTEEPEQEEKKEEKEEKLRFVPEGMVLPLGDEDEEDLVPNFNMNRPEMADIGVLSVGKKTADTVAEAAATEPSEPETEEPEINEPVEDKAPEKTNEEKDDFDITLKPGDDFDI
jgi:hypothetical protein